MVIFNLNFEGLSGQQEEDKNCKLQFIHEMKVKREAEVKGEVEVKGEAEVKRVKVKGE